MNRIKELEQLIEAWVETHAGEEGPTSRMEATSYYREVWGWEEELANLRK